MKPLGLADGLMVYQELYQQVDVNASYNGWKTCADGICDQLTKEEPRTFYGKDSGAITEQLYRTALRRDNYRF